jgi:hypothetical protein
MSTAYTAVQRHKGRKKGMQKDMKIERKIMKAVISSGLWAKIRTWNS